MTLMKTEPVDVKNGTDMVATEGVVGPRWLTWMRFPLIPQIRMRSANEYNTTSFFIRWLAFQFWTLDSICVEVDVRLEEDFGAFVQLPYCKMGVSIPLLPQCSLQRLWRRPSALQRQY